MKSLASFRTQALFAAAALSLFSACGHDFRAATPRGFVELEDQESYDYRATSADGLVIGVREIDNEPRGELDFWARAIENQLRGRRGYALLETREIRSKDGVPGKQFRFGHDEGQTPHLYYLSVFVTPKRIQILEVGGTKELMAKSSTATDFAIANFSVN
ncbi:MAG TPA: serine/threonine protein kinase [Polyangiaceae bacterium]